MTLDEAITKEKEISEEKFIESKEIFKWQKEHEELYECAREHVQLAEWLEELKAIKDGAVFYSNRPIEYIVLEAREAAIAECRKTYIDFISWICERYDIHIRYEDLAMDFAMHLARQQLKE